MTYTIRLLQIALVCVIGVCGFWLGVLLAYKSDVLEQKLPSVWGTMQDNNLPIKGVLQVEPNYGYQTDQYTPIQPAEGFTLEELNGFTKVKEINQSKE